MIRLDDDRSWRIGRRVRRRERTGLTTVVVVVVYGTSGVVVFTMKDEVNDN